MATVTVPREFFQGELRVYSSTGWREAFARELLQNATDAKPTRIDVRFEDIDGHGRVTFSDDGTGMSRAVLEDVFFALGRTTKSGPDSIGGFGRARIIICFAQTRYQIRTRDLLVTGSGGEYTIEQTGDYRRGCEFVIDLLDETSDQVKDAFIHLLRTCTLTVPVTIDGQRMHGRQLPTRASRVLRDDTGTPWGRAYVDTDGIGRLLVRVHGLTMYSRWLSTSDDVVLELVPGKSRQVLSASRDQLAGPYGDQLDEFTADLARNRRKALRPPDAPLDLRVGGGGFFATDADTPVEPRPPAQPDPGLDGGIPISVTAANDAAQQHALEHVAAYAAAALAAGHGVETQTRQPAGYRPLGFDVFLMADANDSRVRKLARAWDPSNWDERTGRRRRALLLAWKAAVSHAMDAFVTAHPELGRIVWTVGWTFDQDAQAIHRSAGEDKHVLALNPVTDTGAVRYRPSDRASRQKLLAIAAHEVCHVAAAGHDEQFAGLLTDLYGVLDPVAADRVIRQAAKAG